MDGFRDTGGFSRIERLYGAMRHCAETAVARAAVAQNEESRCALREAFAQIRAAGFLAHGVKIGRLEELAYLLIRRAARYSSLEPGRLGVLLLLFSLLIHKVFRLTAYCLLLHPASMGFLAAVTSSSLLRLHLVGA